MAKKILYSISLISLHLTGYSIENSKIDLMWKGRGVKAQERVMETEQRSSKSTLKELPKPLQCEYILEKSFALFSNPISSKIVKKANKAADSYILFFKASDSTHTQISFLYSGGKRIAINVPELSPNWKLTILASAMLVLDGEGCNFIFSIDNPLGGEASVSE